MQLILNRITVGFREILLNFLNRFQLLFIFSLALHIAVQNNNLAVVKVLLAQCDVDVYAMNSKFVLYSVSSTMFKICFKKNLFRGMSPLHLLGAYGKENSTLILDSFLETLPTYNLDQKDQKGNSCLLLAYQNGNGNLCRALVKCGAALGAYNEDGLSIFNFPVATKQLLYKLLGKLIWKCYHISDYFSISLFSLIRCLMHCHSTFIIIIFK